MKILFYGAGVMGSLYAAKLQASGQDVSILARGNRLSAIREHGLVLEEGITGSRMSAQIKVVEVLNPEDAYDLVVVMMPKKNIPEILPILAENRRTPNVLFMFNNAAGPDQMVQALGRDRVLLGFPGAGGKMNGHIVQYSIVSGRQQPTTLGELDGSASLRLKNFIKSFKIAGFPVAISANMDAWLKTHATEICPMANALTMAEGQIKTLANDPKSLGLAVRAIKEGYRVLNALHIPITPARRRLFALIPERILVGLMRRVLRSKKAALLIGHADTARDEMEDLCSEVMALAQSASVLTPALDQQLQFNQDMNTMASSAFLLLSFWPGSSMGQTMNKDI